MYLELRLDNYSLKIIVLKYLLEYVNMVFHLYNKKNLLFKIFLTYSLNFCFIVRIFLYNNYNLKTRAPQF